MERRAVSRGERWRREATRGIDDSRVAAALEALPSIRKPWSACGRLDLRGDGRFDGLDPRGQPADPHAAAEGLGHA
jgi:hypothetical protein